MTGEFNEGIPIDTSIQGSPENVWYNHMYDSVRKNLIRDAARTYETEGNRLLLVENENKVDFAPAGISRYKVSADVYKC